MVVKYTVITTLVRRVTEVCLFMRITDLSSGKSKLWERGNIIFMNEWRGRGGNIWGTQEENNEMIFLYSCLITGKGMNQLWRVGHTADENLMRRRGWMPENRSSMQINLLIESSSGEKRVCLFSQRSIYSRVKVRQRLRQMWLDNKAVSICQCLLRNSIRPTQKYISPSELERR